MAAQQGPGTSAGPLVRTGESADPATPFASRLANRFMFAELVGTMFYTMVSAGTVVSSGMITNNVSYQKLTMGRVLMLALANGLTLSALMYTFYSFLDVQQRSASLRYRELEPEEHVFIKAHNANGWLDGKVLQRRVNDVIPQTSVIRPGDHVTYQVEAFRTGVQKLVPRDAIRTKLVAGMIATTDDNCSVTIMSNGLSQQHQNVYDIQYFDGTKDKADLFSLRIPARPRYVVGHFNPAITYAVCLIGDIKPEQAVMYIFAQLFGGTLGVMFVDMVVPADFKAQLGTPMLGDGVTFAHGVRAEAVLTALLIFTVCFAFVAPLGRESIARHPFTTREMAPLVVGLLMFVLTIVGAPLTGPSLNVARSFSSSLVTLTWDNHMVYWIGPWLGSMVGVFSWAVFGNFNEFSRTWNDRYPKTMDRLQWLVKNELVTWSVVRFVQGIVGCTSCLSGG